MDKSLTYQYLLDRLGKPAEKVPKWGNPGQQSGPKVAFDHKGPGRLYRPRASSAGPGPQGERKEVAVDMTCKWCGDDLLPGQEDYCSENCRVNDMEACIDPEERLKLQRKFDAWLKRQEKGERV